MRSAPLTLALLLSSVSAQTSTETPPKVHYVKCSAMHTYCADQAKFGEGSECIRMKILELPTAQDRTLVGWTNLNDYIIKTEGLKLGAQTGTEYSICASRDLVEQMNTITGGKENQSFVESVTKAKVTFKIQPQIPQYDLSKSEETIKKDIENYNKLNVDQKAARR